jgi:hypothetical protein
LPVNGGPTLTTFGSEVVFVQLIRRQDSWAQNTRFKARKAPPTFADAVTPESAVRRPPGSDIKVCRQNRFLIRHNAQRRVGLSSASVHDPEDENKLAGVFVGLKGYTLPQAAVSRIPSANHLPQPGRRKCITLQLSSRGQGSWNGQLPIKQYPRQGRREGGKPPATARLRTPACLTGTTLTPATHQAPSASAPARTREVWQQGWQPSCPLDPFPLRRGRRTSQGCDSRLRLQPILQDFSVILRCASCVSSVIGTPHLGDRHTPSL